MRAVHVFLAQVQRMMIAELHDVREMERSTPDRPALPTAPESALSRDCAPRL
jgi:hypothetical protein